MKSKPLVGLMGFITAGTAEVVQNGIPVELVDRIESGVVSLVSAVLVPLIISGIKKLFARLKGKEASDAY